MSTAAGSRPGGRAGGVQPADSRTEAELWAALDAMAPSDAELLLSEFASAIFPAGVGDPAQVTWPEAPAVGVRTDGARAPAPNRQQLAELRYRTLIEQIPAVTFMAALGQGENEIYVSPHIETLLGFTQKEWLENPFLWYTQLHPDDRAIWHAEFARGCRTGGPFRAECRFIARDGRVVWVRGEARLIKDDLGRPLFLQGVAFDITESKKTEARVLREAVRTTEERYRDLVEQLGAVFWEADGSTPGFSFVSQGAEQVLGVPAERWLAEPDFLTTRIHPEDREAVAAAFDRVKARHTGVEEVEFRAQRADDRTIWLHQKVYAHRLPDGSQRLLGVIFDITARKQAEQILRENEARLRTETDIRRTLHRIGSTLVSELDLERIVQLATDEATTLTTAEFGAFFYNVTNEQGESYMLYTLSGASREAFEGFPLPRNTPIFRPTFAGEGVVRLDDVTADPNYGRNPPYHGMPKGHLPVRSYLAVPVVSRSGDVLGGLFFGHSRPGMFTEEHAKLAAGIAGWTALAIDNARLYNAAERARQSAEAANRAKDEFLATMSHELRTPLNAVLGWVMILRGAEEEAMRQRAIDTIERNARAQGQIIEDLLDVSRVVTGKLTLDSVAVDLMAVIESALDAIRLAADAKRIVIVRRVDKAAAIVMGDAMRLHQVVSNLLTNAVKFTPPGGRIEVSLERSAAMARISVSDSGEGIDPSFLPHVFERFRQADSSASRVHGGLGLGLAIVRHLVELHGGTVRAESAGRGQGARFVVEIPLMQAQEGASHGTEPRGTDDRLQGVRVLVVEDETDARDLVTMMLERVGATVTVATSAAEALERMAATDVDVILSDIGLPKQDGYEFIGNVRRLPSKVASVPAVAVTAYARPEDRARALSAGFQAHIAKPIVAGELIETVERLAGIRRS